ncbi:hypothetical protein AWC38_SpisGene19803 [Stylophora pistillata]|uniref:Zinc finger protein 862 n=1 Tax=Stylophora pistillata TaxID=50429 RepID=A0A2B4RI64_STYPI|nr:hypothetical protein AWC38_SpisGene19803 [Stylophora pistillata]
MERRNLHKDKMTGFGSDGASVMRGKNNGVSKQMKDDSPFLVSIHCMAHRLALCTSQAANGIPYLAKFKEILTDLYRYFDKSALQSLAEFETIFEHPELEIKEVFDIRWLSFYGALETMYRTRPSLPAYVESRHHPRGFKKSLKEFNIIATLCMMMDVILILTFISLALQKEHVELASVQAQIPQIVVKAFGILSLHNVRFQNENLSTYGNEELETLLSHYGSAKEPKVVKMYQQLWMSKNAELNGTLLKGWLLESITRGPHC